MSDPPACNPTPPDESGSPSSLGASSESNKLAGDANLKAARLQAELDITAPKPSEISRQPDPDTNLGLLQASKAQAELDSYQQDTKERKKYARGFFILSCVWIAVICGLLTLQGFGSFWFGKMPFKLSEPVILATIGSTTVNILGILYIVANYLFPKRGAPDKT